jgi:hypothetical protein
VAKFNCSLSHCYRESAKSPSVQIRDQFRETKNEQNFRSLTFVWHAFCNASSHRRQNRHSDLQQKIHLEVFSEPFRKKNMLTATAPSNDFVSTLTASAQNETALSDIEILRRVCKIRSGWSASERIERRQVADERFASLLQALELDTHAA